MFIINKNKFNSKDELYNSLIKDSKLLLTKEDEVLSNLANASSILNEYLPDINWVGFYLKKDNYLYLGPFQGYVACTKIMYNKGVCGTSFSQKKTVVVPDTSKFPGHIVCDSRSLSEIVIPIMKDDEVFAVLDIDSPVLNRFDDTDKLFLEEFVHVLEQLIK
ncbi:MAG: GAF domain-containing protein [Anaeroplasmataceae bacterium]